jgi:Glycosyl transferase family 2
MTLVSVAFPVWRAAETLERAFACVTAQSHRELEIFLVLNGSDEATTVLTRRLAAREPRARVIERPTANLAAALNVSLKEASGEFVARMDADDSCSPDRIARQVAYLQEHPEVAAVGCAYDVTTHNGQRLFTVRPPTTPAQARWKLLLGNSFAHGSMLLRRSAILGVGGYDQRCERAQDFELWLRLLRVGKMAALSDVLYTHTVRDEADASRSTSEQSQVATGAMLEAWTGLPSAKDQSALKSAMVAAMSKGQDADEARERIERVLSDEGPSREGLLAWLWVRQVAPPASHLAAEVARRARVREVAAMMRRQGVTKAWLWGAGDHTRKVLDHAEDLGMPVSGIIDDVVMGERFGMAVRQPTTLAAGDAVLLSSDWHESALWESARPHAKRGVLVFRLYEQGGT